MIKAVETTERLQTSLEEGESQVQSFLVGNPGMRSDISGYHAIEKIEEILGHAAVVLYIYGRMGAGKTDFAALLAEIWKNITPDGMIVTNIMSLEEADVHVNSYRELMEWIDVRKPEDTEFIFLFDEASTSASGRGATGHQAGELFAPLVYRIRKVGGGIVTIGHDGGDIHPSIRAIADVVEKESKKRATFYETIRNRTPREELFSLAGIPPTSYTFDTRESSSWRWTDADDEDAGVEEAIKEREDELREEERKRMVVVAVENDLLDRGAAANLCDVSTRTIDRWRKQMDPDMDDVGGDQS
jgi:hypothetical protein